MQFCYLFEAAHIRSVSISNVGIFGQAVHSSCSLDVFVYTCMYCLCMEGLDYHAPNFHLTDHKFLIFFCNVMKVVVKYYPSSPEWAQHHHHHPRIIQKLQHCIGYTKLFVARGLFCLLLLLSCENREKKSREKG